MRTVISALTVITLGLFIGSAAAQTAPADSAIKGALYDIQRAEKQIGTLTPSRKANIKRLERSMSMAAQRLNASQNKGHASWQEANGRLTKVRQALAALAAGRMPGAAPAPGRRRKTAQPTAPAGGGATPADSQVTARTQGNRQDRRRIGPHDDTEPGAAQAVHDPAQCRGQQAQVGAE